MTVDIYVIGSYKGGKNTFVAFVEYADGTRWVTHGVRIGAKMDTEAEIMLVMLHYMVHFKVNAVIHTNLIDATKLGNNKWTSDFIRANTELTKKYVQYIRDVRATLKVDFITELDNKIFRVFEYLADTIQDDTISTAPPVKTVWQKTIPRFGLTLRKPNGSVFDRPLTDYEFFGSLREAKKVAAWWDKEVTDKNSHFYGYKVERYNIPTD